VTGPWDIPATWLLLPCAQLANAIFTFWGALVLAIVAARCAPTTGVAKWMLLTPLAKLAVDTASGIPANAYALSEFAGTRWDLGGFAFGVGYEIQDPSPALSLRLSALKGEQWYQLSVGDGFAHAAYYRGGAWLLLSLMTAVALIACMKLVRRLRAWRRFNAALEVRFGSPSGTGHHRLGAIRIRRCLDRRDGAFTTGILRPTIWLPRADAGLSPAVRSAVLRHELGHVRGGDVPLFAMLGLLSDLLWFVPGTRWLEARIRARAERAADLWAVRHGADPAALASALLSTAESRLDVAYGASASGASNTGTRVRALLAPDTARSRLRVAALTILSAVMLLIAMRSTFLGYH